jgi:hypothetical protein
MKRVGLILLLAALCAAVLPGGALAAPSPAPTSATPTVIPTSVTLANKSQVSLLDVAFNADGTSTWRYQVTELAGAADLTSVVLQLGACATQTAAIPADGTVQPDAGSGLTGTKWTLAPAFQQGEFSVTVNGPVTLGTTSVATAATNATTGKIAGPVCGAALPLTVTLSNGYRVTLLGLIANADRTITWRYQVDELPTAQDLSNWVLELSNCVVADATPEPWEIVNPDPNAKLYGVKWQPGGGFVTGEFTVTLEGPLTFGLLRAAVKGPDVVIGQLAGPICTEGEVEPPAEIVITPPTTAPQVVIQNNVALVVYAIEINNRGGDADDVKLVLDLGDDLDLDDLVFLERTGYVVEIKGTQVVIALGRNNTLFRNEGIKLQFKFKAKGDGKREIKTKFRYSVVFGDSAGAQTVAPVSVDVTIPAVVVTAPVVVAPVVGVVQRLPAERVDVRFRARWNSGGGLRIYGLPLGEPITLTSGVIVQYFERARFEYHPENEGTPFVILLGLLGTELGYAQPPVAPPTSTTTISATWYYTQTGHYIAEPFRTFWRVQGGLLTFGYPIGEAFTDSNGRLVQYFERARLEYHPELAGTEYTVLLGFLGEEAIVKNGGRGRDR